MIFSAPLYDYSLDANLSGDISAPPLLLLHGFTGSHKIWSPIRNQLGYPSVAIDLPGHGCTVRNSTAGNTNFESIIADLCAVLDFLHLEKVHLCGYSMGGRISLAFAMAHPDRLQSLILESASAGIAAQSERIARSAADAALANKITSNFERFIEDWSRLPFFSKQAERNVLEWKRNNEIRRDSDPHNLAEALVSLGTGSQPCYLSRLPTLKLPTLLITGSEDEKFCRIANQMASLFPAAKQASIPHSGHTPHLEQPGEFCKLLSAWVITDYKKFISAE